MKLVTDQIDNLELSSPQEVIEFRKNRGSGKNFDFRMPLTKEIQEKINYIHQVHGFNFEKDGYGLMQRIQHDLLFEYDFKLGYLSTFGDASFPDYITKNQPRIKKVIERIRMIFEAFGWVVTFSEDKYWYYLNFAPLLALTPEEVNAEIEQRVNILASKALKVINEGLIKQQSHFYRKEIGLAPAMVIPEDVDLVINRLKLLLGPKWLLTNWNFHSFDIFPNTTP